MSESGFCAARRDNEGECRFAKASWGLRRELLDRMLIVNEGHLRATLTTYLAHRNEVRPHHGLGMLTRWRPRPGSQRRSTWRIDYQICRKAVLGGLPRIPDRRLTAPRAAQKTVEQSQLRISEPHGMTNGLGAGHECDNDSTLLFLLAGNCDYPSECGSLVMTVSQPPVFPRFFPVPELVWN